MNPERKGDIYALICGAICGLGNIVAKTGLENISALLFNFYFFSFAFVIVSLALFKKENRIEIIKTKPKTIGLIFIMAFLFTFGIYFFMSALKLIEPATVSFLSRMEIILVIVFAYIILKERLTVGEIIGGIIAVGGVLVLKYKTTFIISQAATLMILSAFFFAAAEIILKKNIERLSSMRFIFFRNLFTVIIVFIYIIIIDEPLILPSTKTLLLTFTAALLLPILGRFTFMESIKRINISRAAFITQATPLFTTLFAFVILKSLPTPIEWLGGGLIILGVVVVKLSAQKMLSGFARLRS